MAWTNWGFDGTINEAQWAQMAGLLGNGYVAAGNGDCAVTAVAGQRKVSVAAGTLFGDGIVSVNSGAEEVTLTTPANGQWYVIALRRTWASNTAALVAVAAATTTTTTPTSAPTSLPTLNTNTGVLTDQPIAWAWCNSANTTVVVFDMRQFPVRTMPPTVASAAVRDAKYQSPTQGLQVWRDDLGAVETYYGLYNASTNPGGRDAAGWYTTSRAGGLVPIKPPTVTVVSGTGVASALGKITVTNATSVSFDNVFTSKYDNYRILITATSSVASDLKHQDRAGGVDITSGYLQRGFYATATALNNYPRDNGANNELIWFTAAEQASAVVDLFAPAKAQKTLLQVTSYGGNTVNSAGYRNSNSAVDGMTIYTVTGTFSGTIQIFGVVE